MIHSLRMLIRVLFEPVFIGFALGIILFVSLLRYGGKKKKITWLILFLSLLALFSWRSALSFLMASSRYYSIFIFAGIFLTAWFCIKVFSFYRLLTWKKNGCRCPVRLRWIISAFLIGIVAVVCLCKSLRYTHNQAYMKRIGEAVQLYSAGKDILLFSNIEQNRLAYYGKRNIDEIYPVGVSSVMSEFEMVKKLVHEMDDYGEECFIVYSLSKHTPELTPENLELPQSYGKWELLQSEYTSPRKKKKIQLSRFTPRNTRIRCVDSFPADHTPDINCCKNGDFEVILKEPERKKRQEFFTKNNISLYLDHDYVFPEAWGLGITELNKSNPPLICLSDKEPIQGAWSLTADSRHTETPAIFCCRDMPVKNYRYSLLLQNLSEKPSQVYISVIAWLPKQKKSFCYEKIKGFLLPGKKYSVESFIAAKEFPSDAITLSIYFHVEGYIKLDSVSVCPMPDKGKTDQ